MAADTYDVAMSRAGRHINPAPFQVTGDGPTEVAAAIYTHIKAKKLMASATFEVVVFLDDDFDSSIVVLLDGGRSGNGNAVVASL